MIIYAIILSTIAILTHNTTAITMLTMHHVTITTKTIAVQILILEDAADTEDNNINTIKPIVLYMYYRLLSYITRILFNSSKYS